MNSFVERLVGEHVGVDLIVEVGPLLRREHVAHDRQDRAQQRLRHESNSHRLLLRVGTGMNVTKGEVGLENRGQFAWYCSKKDVKRRAQFWNCSRDFSLGAFIACAGGRVRFWAKKLTGGPKGR